MGTEKKLLHTLNQPPMALALADVKKYDSDKNQFCCKDMPLLAWEQALKVKWEPALIAYNFEYLRLESGCEILIGQML
jgi:hypothetical protein